MINLLKIMNTITYSSCVEGLFKLLILICVKQMYKRLTWDYFKVSCFQSSGPVVLLVVGQFKSFTNSRFLAKKFETFGDGMLVFTKFTLGFLFCIGKSS